MHRTTVNITITTEHERDNTTQTTTYTGNITYR